MKKYLKICAFDFYLLLVIFIVDIFASINLKSFIGDHPFGSPIPGHLQAAMQAVLYPMFLIHHLCIIASLWIWNSTFFIPKIKKYYLVLFLFQMIMTVIVISSLDTLISTYYEGFSYADSSLYEIFQHYINGNITYLIDYIKSIGDTKSLLGKRASFNGVLFSAILYIIFKFYMLRKWV